MCYGSKCDFEGYMGECNILSVSKFRQIETELGYTACFIGGATTDPEEHDYFNKLFREGKIQEMLIKASNIVYKREVYKY